MMFDGSETRFQCQTKMLEEKGMSIIPNIYGLIFPVCQFQLSARKIEFISSAEEFQ